MSSVHMLAQLDLNLLVVLDELLRSRSTTLAARRLGRTQSAVSHALARLRDAFGDPLLVRAGSGLKPTSTAVRLEAPLRDVLLKAASLLSGTSAGFSPANIERSFTLACTDFAELVLMPRLLPVLRREAPGAAVEITFRGDDAERAAQAREIDLAYGTRFRALSGVVVDKVREEDFVVLLRRGHPALRGKMTAKSYAALDHVLVAPRGLPGSPVDTALEELGLSRRVILRTPHFAAAAFAVSETDLVVTLPENVSKKLGKRLELVARPLPFALRGLTFLVAYSTSFVDDPAHRWFRERVIDIGRG